MSAIPMAPMYGNGQPDLPPEPPAFMSSLPNNRQRANIPSMPPMGRSLHDGPVNSTPSEVQDIGFPVSEPNHELLTIHCAAICDEATSLACVECKKPIQPNQRFVAWTVEDPSIPMTDARKVAQDTYEKVIVPAMTGRMPFSINYFIRVAHVDGRATEKGENCLVAMRNKSNANICKRLSLPHGTAMRELLTRTKIFEFYEQFHLSKMNIIRAYPDCTRLTVQCLLRDPKDVDVPPIPPTVDMPNPANGNKTNTKGKKGSSDDDNPMDDEMRKEMDDTLAANSYERQTSALNSSFFILMPQQIANILFIRDGAWTLGHMIGMFQRVVISKVTCANTAPIPLQVQSMIKAVKEAMKNKEVAGFVDGVVMAHRMPSNDKEKTEWRLVQRYDIAESVMKQLWWLFRTEFVDPNATVPEIMTWEQAVADIELPHPGIGQGQKKIYKRQRIQMWLARRDEALKKLDLAARLVRIAISKLSTKEFDPLIAIDINSHDRIATKHGAEIFIYRVNAQPIDIQYGIQSNKQYYCMRENGTDLKCYSRFVDPSKQDKTPDDPFLHIPILYTDEAEHTEFMKDNSFVENPLEYFTLIYHVDPAYVASVNASHPLPSK